MQEDQQGGQFLAALRDAELRGLAHGILGVRAGVGQAYHLGLAGLGLQQIGSEIGAGQRRAHIAQDLAAVRLDDIAGVAFQRMAESIVRRDEEPAVS
ncbi:hypothetical protein G6F31_020257 [Rhizopus arrhizus]|uniref:Uncharacterized protein n=1 Tax=Rhizopus delemar TaxID=936053 RepID=A0A9P7BZY4_9FUNG|nr:hypothetical protein G6F31_020257 [Rhizopus arrhizus]KAG1529895.1 hypothetical protein G6F50_017686 [Rhizopus delemar]